VSQFGRTTSVKLASGKAAWCANWFIGALPSGVGPGTLVHGAPGDLHQHDRIGIKIGLDRDVPDLVSERRAGR
jgi:hypothetical protein